MERTPNPFGLSARALRGSLSCTSKGPRFKGSADRRLQIQGEGQTAANRAGGRDRPNGILAEQGVGRADPPEVAVRARPAHDRGVEAEPRIGDLAVAPR